MDLQKDKYIIVEIIPTRSSPENGFIAQISALKLEGTTLIDRFDYRVREQLIENDDIRRMISYDKEMFNYQGNEFFILEKFKRWAKGYPLLTVDDTYTPKYFEPLPNKQELVFPYLHMENSEDVFDRIRKKYSIAPTNHLVDIIYEAIIWEGNNKAYQKTQS